MPPNRAIALPLVLLTACTLVPRKYEPMQKALPRYYGASFDVERADRAAELDERAESLARDAAAVLQVGRRIAFFPPDSCLDTTSGSQSNGDQEYIEMRCGVLMSSLETHMARAGYEVISWQALKPSMAGLGSSQAGGSALERARSLDVDVLFEVDQLAAGERQIGQTRATGIDFFEATGRSERVPLTVERETALQCKEISDRIVGMSNSPEPAASLSSKAVDVPTGRAIWYFQKTRTEGIDRSADVAREYYFKAAPILPDPGQPTPLHNSKQRTGRGVHEAGSWIFGLGALTAAIGVGPTAVDLEGGAVVLGVGSAVAAFGGAIMAAGGAIIADGNERARRPVPLPPEFQPRYPGAEQVLCRTRPATPPWMHVPTAIDDDELDDEPPPATSDRGSSFSFNDETATPDGPDQQVVERLFDDVVQDFVGELKALSATYVPP